MYTERTTQSNLIQKWRLIKWWKVNDLHDCSNLYWWLSLSYLDIMYSQNSQLCMHSKKYVHERMKMASIYFLSIYTDTRIWILHQKYLSHISTINFCSNWQTIQTYFNQRWRSYLPISVYLVQSTIYRRSYNYLF